MPKENNKMQVDIDNLFKQNVNDLSSIKELYRKLKEVEEKILQIKYIDSNLANKLKKEYEKLKRIILDENVSATLSDEIETINSQMEKIITLANNDIQEKLNKGGHIKLIGNINLTRTLYIKDNTILEMDSNSKIISNFDGVILQVEGNNIEIRNVNIDCNNNACTGIFVNSNSKDITIKNNSVKNSYGGNSKPVYGIFVSAIGCKNVVIDNNIVDNLISKDDGEIAQRDGGWAKGILVDLYDLIQLPSVIDQDNISQNIIISNNQVSNIADSSDADGIYIEGYKPSLKNNIIINNNSLYNCHKRFIKVLNASNVQILNNYGYNDENIVMHSHISLYSSENTLLGNTMIANSRYGVELGYQSKYEDYLVKDIVIDNNKFDIHDKLDYGTVICRGDFTGRYKDIVINNNILIGGRRSVFLTNGSDIDTIKITNNTCRDINNNSCFVEFDGLNIGQLNIENNRFISDTKPTNIIMAYPSTTGYKVNTCIISNNISPDTLNSAYSIKYVDNLIITDNKINSSIPYGLTSVTNRMIKNNYNLKTGLPCETEVKQETFEYKAINISDVTIDVSDKPQVYSFKIAPSVATTLTSLTGNTGQIVNLITSNSTGFTINHSNDIHLKNSTNITLNSMEQCITLIKLDNRWLEISRNF